MNEEHKNNKSPLDLVAKATVKFLKSGAQGVLVDGGFILTAAHSIVHCSREGPILPRIQGYVEDIETADGTRIQATPRVIEAVSDVALFDTLDTMWHDCDEGAARNFCARTKPVTFFRDALPDEPMPVWILSHAGEWICGKITSQFERASQLLPLSSDDPVDSGSSGGPIVTADGELVGIVSPLDKDDDYSRVVARPHLVLPPWTTNLMSSDRLRDNS